MDYMSNDALDIPVDLDALYQRVAHVIPSVEWATMKEDVAAIWRLKAQRNAVIMAHAYMTPDIYYCVADITGDSLALARKAQEVDAQVIVLAGVHFMAETAKILNPEKTVLIPDPQAGCSLADSITSKDIEKLRAQHPGVPVVTYVNTSAEVKAASDICCTSGNAEKIIESLHTDKVIMVPDQYLARNIGARTGVEMILHPGSCEVHERFTPEDIKAIRDGHPGVTVISHPECPPEVIAVSDFSGSTAQMADFVANEHPDQVALITECSLSDNIATQYPDLKMVRPCNLCPHMKRNTLKTIRQALENMEHEVTVPESVAQKARKSIEKMLAVF